VIDPSLVVREDGSQARKWGKISLVAGGVGLVIGGVFGVMAMSAKSDADELFKAGNAGFKAKDEDASTNAAVSTVGFGIGLVGAAIGTYLLVTAKSDRPHHGGLWPTANGVAGRF
jgi:acetaldehyde dehydrogenase (acetylating)